MNRKPTFVLTFLCLGMLALTSCSWQPGQTADEKIVRLPIRSYVKNVDPVRCQTKYENQIMSLMYETLVQYKYLARPLQLEPLLLESMPDVSDDAKIYTFTLKQKALFHDDPCFAEGKGRQVTTDDVFYSWKRMANNANKPKGWWLFEKTIKGFDDYKKVENEKRLERKKRIADPSLGAVDDVAITGEEDLSKAEKAKRLATIADNDYFDYDAPVPGFVKLDEYRFKVILNEPVVGFIWKLAMPQTSIVPREACDTYQKRFSLHPVGTGPFVLREEDWVPNLKLTLRRNPNYHECYYPEEHESSDEEFGFHLAAGTRLPIPDRVELRLFGQDQPMWLRFRTKEIDYTEVPGEYYRKAYIKRNRQLRPKFIEEGIVAHDVELLDFTFRGFNMGDKIVGGYTEEKKNLRRAISLCVDRHEFNETFYNGINIVYDGCIPPALAGHPKDHVIPNNYNGPDIERARKLLADAGYPNGQGLPKLNYFTNKNALNKEMAEMFKRQVGKIGIKIDVRLVDFPTLMQTVDAGKAQIFSFAWGSDYPDAENNLALFYGPNLPPGSNHFRYQRDEFDDMYRQIRSMQDSPERTAVYERMNALLIEDVPFIGSMARTRHFIVNPRLKNFKPSEDFYNWVKYLDVDENVPQL